MVSCKENLNLRPSLTIYRIHISEPELLYLQKRGNNELLCRPYIVTRINEVDNIW